MRLRTQAILGLLAMGTLYLGGCASSSSWRTPHSRVVAPASQGHAAELVFSPPTSLDDNTYGDPYYDRRDPALGVPSGSTQLQSLAYPGQPAPDLYEQHWLTLRRSADQFIYFERWPRYDGDWYDSRRYEPLPCPVRRYDRAW